MLINKVFDQYSDDVWHDAEHREGAQARLLVLESCDEAGKRTKVVAVKERAVSLCSANNYRATVGTGG